MYVWIYAWMYSCGQWRVSYLQLVTSPLCRHKLKINQRKEREFTDPQPGMGWKYDYPWGFLTYIVHLRSTWFNGTSYGSLFYQGSLASGSLGQSEQKWQVLFKWLWAWGKEFLEIRFREKAHFAFPLVSYIRLHRVKGRADWPAPNYHMHGRKVWVLCAESYSVYRELYEESCYPPNKIRHLTLETLSK